MWKQNTGRKIIIITLLSLNIYKHGVTNTNKQTIVCMRKKRKEKQKKDKHNELFMLQQDFYNSMIKNKCLSVFNIAAILGLLMFQLYNEIVCG